MKERVIGAVVLVVIAVLVVPVFLDGPAKDAERVSETVTLPGQNGSSRKRQTIVLERDRDQPVPAAARPSDRAAPVAELAAHGMAGTRPAQGRPEPEPAAQTPVETATPLVAESKAATRAEAPDRERPAAPPSASAEAADTESATGMWAVQLGSFSNEANAERLAATLREQGFAAFLSELHTGSGDLHRVRIGPQKDRDSAEAVAAKLGQAGHEGQVVPHP